MLHAQPVADVDDVIEDCVGALLAGARAEAVLTRALRAHRSFSNEERGAVARRTLGVAVFRARLAYIAACRGLDVTPAVLVALYRETVEGRTEAPEATEATEGADDVDGVVWPADPVARLAARRSLPQALAAHFVRERGVDDADRLLAAMNLPGPRTLRVNTLRGARDDVARRLADEGIETVPARHAPHALHVVGRANLFGSRAWRDGAFEVQDEGSQLIVEATQAQPDMRVLDLCAGRGGKTLGLAARMHDRGQLEAFDIDARATADLRPRLVRAGVTCARSVDAPSGAYDVVLVDAPCSSLGTLRRSPDLRFHIDAKALDALPALQCDILARGASLVRPGGVLVYATCTLRRAENEDVAATVTSSFHAISEETLLPHVHGTDGFYLAVWRRSSMGV